MRREDMEEKTRKPPYRPLIGVAWARNGKSDTIITGEALILACLMKTHGDNRSGSDFKEVQKLMKDINYDERDS